MNLKFFFYTINISFILGPHNIIILLISIDEYEDMQNHATTDDQDYQNMTCK